MPYFHFDHTAIAVRSIKAALPLFKDALGGEYLMGGDIDGVWRWFQLRHSSGPRMPSEP